MLKKPQRRQSILYTLRFIYQQIEFVLYDTEENLKRWSEAWARATLTIEEEKKARFRDPDYHRKTIEQFDDMLDYVVENSIPSTTSGLIEMQRYFMKLRPKVF